MFLCCLLGISVPFVTATAAEKNTAKKTAKKNSAAPASNAPPVYERDILPILKAKCVRCHGDKTRKGELNLASLAGLREGGESGAVVAPHKVAESPLYEQVFEELMPPDDGEPLSAEEIKLIGRWIGAGAPLATGGFLDSSAELKISQHDITPILLRRCTMCHGRSYQDGDLDLRTKAAMLKGGAGGPALVVSQPDASPLVLRIRSRECPPKADLSRAGIEPMKSEELQTLEQWIALGAPLVEEPQDVVVLESDPLIETEERRFWSFQPPRKSPPPVQQASDAAPGLIDAFVLAKLESAGLDFSPPADKLSLLRRATFDLTGLPPSPDEVTRFLHNDSPQAYARLIDRLLASPRYGERWGRYWLDLAGYADSEGKRNADTIRPWAWRYRDYVIRAFNADKPYDRFLLEQIAGDELVDYAAKGSAAGNAEAGVVPKEIIEPLVATGFLRMAPDGTSANPVNRLPDRVEVIADEIDVLSRGVMGLTMKCARCHSHKYDPIPQRDYYRFAALFKGAYDEYDWLVPQVFGNQWDKARQRFLNVMTAAEKQSLDKHNQPIEKEIKRLEAKLKQLKKDTADKSTTAKKKKKLEKQLKAKQAQLQPPPQIRALWDRGDPSPAYLYRRGDENQPARQVEPAPLSVLTTKQTPFNIEPVGHSTPKTGRRLALAKWLTQPSHPLTARVFVNRVWKHHFGVGIVKSLGDFGTQGMAPSHPKLLDTLAVDFMEHGWSIKRLHRKMMNSRVYRQSSALTEKHMLRDPENRLLSRMPLRRMAAEEVRDSLLLVAGRLNERRFGPPDAVEVRKDGLVTSKAEAGKWRRSVYVRQRRKEMPTILETFDLPAMNPNCIQRMDSTIVSQSLHLLNNEMVHTLAASFAERVRQEVGNDPAQQLERAWLIALNRSPTAEEQAAGAEALTDLQHRWMLELATESGETDQTELAKQKETASQKALADFCHALVNSAAFLYLD